MLNPAEEAALQENAITKSDDMTEIVPLGDIRYDRENQEKEPSTAPEPEAESNNGNSPKEKYEDKVHSEPQHEKSPKKQSYENILCAIDSIKGQLDDLKSRLSRGGGK